MFLFCIPSGTVRIILCVCTIGNDKKLDILIQSTSCPERIPLIAVVMLRTIFHANHVLIDDLQPVVMNVLLFSNSIHYLKF